MILCWGEGQSSQIHDHSDSHCFMKMLKGELREIRYTWPKNNPKAIECSGYSDVFKGQDENNSEYDELYELSRTVMETNSVRYINGE